MFCVQLYFLCTLYVCVVSFTCYKINYPLQYVLFQFLDYEGPKDSDNNL